VVHSDSARTLAGLGGGPGEDDVLEIQRKMLDVEHLDAQAYAEIVLEIDSVTSESESSLVALGRFTLRGITRDVRVPIRVEWADDGTVGLEGVLRVRQRDYGIEPESVAGLVKVSNDVDLHFLLVASPTDQRCARSDG
ncbi:MAG: YceI family protein, partial [Gemmatimonadetes bacterium]|nr:YceI family protein [Gemmatimonadota bacterium]